MMKRPRELTILFERAMTVVAIVVAALSRSTRSAVGWYAVAILFTVWAEGDRVVHDLWKERNER